MHIYYSWLQLVTIGYSWLQLGTVGYSWLQLGTVGYSWLQLGTVGYSWVQLITIGYSWVQLYKCSSVVPTIPTTPTIHLPKTLALAKYNWFNQELAFIKLFLVNDPRHGKTITNSIFKICLQYIPQWRLSQSSLDHLTRPINEVINVLYIQIQEKCY